MDLNYPIVIMNADSDADNEFTVSMIKEKYPDAEIWQQLVGPVIGSHCGRDTIGLIFVAPEK